MACRAKSRWPCHRRRSCQWSRCSELTRMAAPGAEQQVCQARALSDLLLSPKATRPWRRERGGEGGTPHRRHRCCMGWRGEQGLSGRHGAGWAKRGGRHGGRVPVGAEFPRREWGSVFTPLPGTSIRPGPPLAPGARELDGLGRRPRQAPSMASMAAMLTKHWTHGGDAGILRGERRTQT